jgi:copper chaperone
MKLLIQDMSCAGCVRSVTAAVKALDPQAAVSVDLDSKVAELESSQAVDAIIQALDEAGFAAEHAA